MATSRLMTDTGETDKDVTVAVGAANVTKRIELTFDNAITTKDEILLALKRFERRLLTFNFPIA
jgi:hypothetical protein